MEIKSPRGKICLTFAIRYSDNMLRGYLTTAAASYLEENVCYQLLFADDKFVIAPMEKGTKIRIRGGRKIAEFGSAKYKPLLKERFGQCAVRIYGEYIDGFLVFDITKGIKL